MYVYIQTEPNLWTVGFYKPDGMWVPESDHLNRELAGKRVAYLNGGGGEPARGYPPGSTKKTDEGDPLVKFGGY